MIYFILFKPDDVNFHEKLPFRVNVILTNLWSYF